jgi:hypothetical protein
MGEASLCRWLILPTLAQALDVFVSMLVSPKFLARAVKS